MLPAPVVGPCPATLNQDQLNLSAKKRAHSPDSPSPALQQQLQQQLQANSLQLLAAASAASILDTSSSSSTNPWVGSPLKRSRFAPTAAATPSMQQLLMAAGTQLRPIPAAIQPVFNPLQFATTKQPTERFHQQLAQQLRFNTENSAVCISLSLKNDFWERL